MFITVGICTYNRAESLRRTLDSLLVMDSPADLGWEVLIINNNSADHTDQVISEYRKQLPVRREFESRPGKSNALNRAIDAARGEYILWTDDDVVVDPGWLQAYVNAFRRWPQASVFGGRIKARYETPVPKWVTESEALLGGPYAIRDFGEEVQPLSLAAVDNLPYGANWAIRAIEQRSFRYNPDLGPVPGRIRVQEEYDVICRVLQCGSTGYWLPDAKVEHCIGRDRQTVGYILKYYAGLGETHGREHRATSVTNPLLLGIPRWVWSSLLKRFLSYQWHRFVSPSPVWVAQLQRYGHIKGIFRYWALKM